jgi:hypothetical protein
LFGYRFPNNSIPASYIAKATQWNQEKENEQNCASIPSTKMPKKPRKTYT